MISDRKVRASGPATTGTHTPFSRPPFFFLSWSARWREDKASSPQECGFKLFDKSGWWKEKVERISSENQVKLERVYVRMPRHQEPMKDVVKLRKASGSRKQAMIRGCPRFGNDTK